MRFVILLVLIAVLGAYASPIEGEVQYETLKGKILHSEFLLKCLVILDFFSKF
jgi:hypothetical protein